MAIADGQARGTVIEAPHAWQAEEGQRSVFLAGGIVNCPNWQANAIAAIGDYYPDALILNPRRSYFDVSDPRQTDIQMEWEVTNLRKVDVALFWYADADEAQAGVAHELGFIGESDQDFVIGVDPRFSRRHLVHAQLRYTWAHREDRRYTIVHESLSDTIAALKPYLTSHKQ